MQLASNKSNKLLCVIVLFLCIFYPVSALGVGNATGWAILLGVWLLNMVWHRGKFYITKERIGYAFMVLVVSIYFVLPNARNDVRSTQSLIINMIIAVLYLLSAKVNSSDIKRITKVVIRTSIVFSGYIILCKIFPNLYFNIFLPYFKGINTAEAELSLESGYGALIANSVTYGPYVICMGIFVCFGYLIFGSTQYSRIRLIIYELIFFVAILCEGRRGELLAAVLALFVLYIISTPNNARKLLKRIGMFLAIVVLGILIIFVLLKNGYLTRFVNTAELIQSGMTDKALNKLTSSRYWLWRYAWGFFISHPIFGIGWSSFASYVVSSVNNVHNCYLQFLCETGIVGFILIITPIILLLVRTLHALKHLISVNSDSIHGMACVLSLGMQLFFLILYVLDPVFYKGYYHLIYIVLILLFEFAVQNKDYKEI